MSAASSKTSKKLVANYIRRSKQRPASRVEPTPWSLLHDLLVHHKASAHRAYVAPLASRIDALGRLVYGSTFKVGLSETPSDRVKDSERAHDRLRLAEQGDPGTTGPSRSSRCCAHCHQGGQRRRGAAHSRRRVGSYGSRPAREHGEHYRLGGCRLPGGHTDLHPRSIQRGSRRDVREIACPVVGRGAPGRRFQDGSGSVSTCKRSKQGG